MNAATKIPQTLAALLLAPLATASISDEDAKWSGLDAEVASMSTATATAAEDDWSVSIKNGLLVQNADGSFSMKLFGRVEFDAGFHSGNDAHPVSGDDDADGVEARRARLGVSGTVHENVDFKAEFDFAGEGTSFKDVYIQFDDLYDARIGHYKEPFGLEEQTSSKHITFVERSQVNEAISPSRNVGLGTTQGFNEGGGTWAIGIFKDTDNDRVRGLGDGEYALTGRLTVAPVHDAATGEVLHFGLSGSLRKVMTERFRSRPEMHLVGRAIDTGTFAANETTQLGVEGAWQNGPFGVQVEYMVADTDTVGAGTDPSQDGYAVQANYFLTGEHRPYKASSAKFDRVKPETSASGFSGGAWEVAARISHVGLEDPFGYADEQDNITLGLNWYRNSNTRIMLNVVTSELDSVGESVDALLLRWHINF